MTRSEADSRSRTLAFLFTDVEGSTRLWDQQPDAMRVALAQHDEILHGAIGEAGGSVVKSTGDGMLAVFDESGAAVRAAVLGQRKLSDATWSTTGQLRVRMAIHCGPATERDGDYYGTTLNRAARIMALGHGGQVLTSEVVAVLLRDDVPAGTKFRDLGEHRLRDLSHVERVHQVDADGFGTEFPPLRSLDAYTTNLPFQPTSFIGRELEIDELSNLVRRERMVTLTGVGGVGKTRLALRIAAELLPDVRDGVWLCELATAEGNDAVCEVVAHALAILPRTGMSLFDSIVEVLRDRECIVVLDNCEHVLDPAADLAAAILHQCRGVRVVATSREGLGVDGEQLRPIRSLEVPDVATAAAALSSDATTLFVERAGAIAPSFRLDDQNAAAIIEVCRRLDGIPLAIELAAARTASLQPSEIAALLDERFRLLTGSRRRTVERHQTLRATVDWSYSLLTERERTVFDRLGVFIGTFDAAAAQSVAADDAIGRFDVLDALDELVAKSMLGAEATVDGTTRYQLLETLRQYALERLELAGHADAFRGRHAGHFASVTAEFGATLYGSGELAARTRLRRDLDNIRAALDWAADTADTDLVLAILVPICPEAGWNRGTGVGAWAARALPLEPVDAVPEWSWVRLAAGFHFYHDTGDFEPALRIAEAVIAWPDAPADERAWACSLRCYTTMALGDFDGGVKDLSDAYAAGTEETGPLTFGVAASLAILVGLSGDTTRAVSLADEAVARARALGAPSAIALAQYAHGIVRMELEPVAARADLEEALRLSDLGTADVVSDRSLHLLSILAWREGDTVGCAGAIARALDRSLAAGDYSACAGAMALAPAVFGAHREWEAAVLVQTALEAGVLTGVISSPQFADLEGATAQAVIDARKALRADAAENARRNGAAMRRDELVRFAITGLERIAADRA